MDYSFYGGRKGAPFLIAEKFKYISSGEAEKRMSKEDAEIKEIKDLHFNELGSEEQKKWYEENCLYDAFKQGNFYTKVGYDEYCIIDSPNKNDKNNGKIFKRGYDINNSVTGGAIYIGQIVGPKGSAPHIKVLNYEEVMEKKNNANTVFSSPNEPTKPEIKLIPGKEGDVFNDNIVWCSASVRDPDNTESIAYFGFKVPYLVNDFLAESVSPYEYTDGTNLIAPEGNLEEHPFYKKWKISVPKGIKGDSFKNLKILSKTPEGTYVEKDVNKEYPQELVYQQVSYDKFEDGENNYISLGPYNMISDIFMSNEGKITIKYTHDPDITLENKVKWIKEINLNPETGIFQIVYNDATCFEKRLKWVKNIELKGTGDLNFYYTDSNEPIPSGQKIRWLDDILYKEDKGVLEFAFNTGDQRLIPFKALQDIDIDTGIEEGEGSQKVKIKYSDSMAAYEIGNPLNYIMETVITEDDYHLLVLYSDPEKRNLIKSLGLSREYPDKNGQVRDDWHDLGCVKSESGIFIGKNLPLTDFKNFRHDEIIQQLNTDYPYGLGRDPITKEITNSELNGKIITIGDSDSDKEYFAFDYSKNETDDYKGWYYLGRISQNNNPGAFAAKETDVSVQSIANSLPEHSLWFVIEGEPDYYIETIAHNGTIKSDKNKYTGLETAQITFEPNQNYILEWVKIDGVLREDIKTSPFNLDISKQNHKIEISFQPIIYKININNSGNGQVTTDKIEYLKGETAQIAFKPDPGYELDSIQIDNNEIIKQPSNPYSFIIQDNHNITVNFSQKIYYTINISIPEPNGGCSARADKSKYLGNEKASVIITPPSAAGYQLTKILLDKQSIPLTSRIEIPINNKNHDIEIFCEDILPKPPVPEPPTPNFKPGDLVKLGTLYRDGKKEGLPDGLGFDNTSLSTGNVVNFEIKDTEKGSELQWRYAEVDNKKLLVCDRHIARGISWDTLNAAGFVEGKTLTIDGKQYKCRIMTGGTEGKVDPDYASTNKDNEWDQIIDGNIGGIGNSNDIWHWKGMYSWCQELVPGSSSARVVRGNGSASFWSYYYPNGTDYYGFRPVLEILSPQPGPKSHIPDVSQKETSIETNSHQEGAN